jgi:hypothetical protein
MTQELLHFSEIIIEIGRLCKQRATGTLFISTGDNRSAQFMLDKGDIVFILFAGKRGQEAVNLMSKIREGRFRFQEGGNISRRMELPPTQDILKILNSGSVLASSSSPVQSEKKVLTGSGLSPEQKSVLESCMADCIGPMAAIICEDHFDSGSDLQTTVEALAAEIPSPVQGKKFREMVAKKLG